MASKRRSYEQLQAPIERLGGSMVHVRKGYCWGAWVIKLNRCNATFVSNGSGYPDLDQLYKPRVAHPRHYRDYTNELVPGAIDKLLGMLK